MHWSPGRYFFGVAAVLAAVALCPTTLSAGRARVSGGGAIIVWDGDRDVSIQNGTGDLDTIQDLHLADLADLAVRTRFVETNSNTAVLLTEGQIPGFSTVRLLLFAVNLENVCGASGAFPPGSPMAPRPSFCTGAQYTTVRDVVGAADFDLQNTEFAKQADPANGKSFALLTPEEKAVLGAKRLISLTLVRGGTDGIWRLAPADRAVVQAVADWFGPDNVKLGVRSVGTSIQGFSELEIVNLSPAPASTVSISYGPDGTGVSPALPLSSIVDLDAGANTTLYAATSLTRLRVSTDAGRTWNTTTDSRRVLQLAVNPLNRAHLLAVYAPATPNTNHVSLSANGGTTWTALTMPSAALGNGGIAWAAFDPFAPGKLYASGNGQFLTSTNGGSTWQAAAIALPLGEPAFSTVAGTFYAVSQNGSSRGLWKTTNSGGAWTRVSLTLSASNTLHLAHGAQGEALFVADGRRVHRSLDGGQSWSSADVFAGGTITSLAVGLDPCAACAPVPRIYAGTDRGIYFSVGGSVWSPLLNLQPAGAAYTRVTAILPGARLTFGTQAGVWTYDPGEQTATQPFDDGGGWGMLALTGVAPSQITKDAEWLSLVTSSSIAAGDATVVFRVLASGKFYPRTGYIDVAGRSLAVSQAPSGCTYSLSAQSMRVAATGTLSGSVQVTTGCDWTAMSNATYVTLTNGPTLTGTQTLTFTVAANTTTPLRTTTIALAGRTFTITQEGPPTLTASKTSLRFAAVRGPSALLSKTTDDVIRVTQNGAGTLPWTASANQPWLTVTSPATTGTQNLTIGVQFAPTLPASGTVTGTVTVTATGTRSDVLATIAVTLDVRSVGTTAPPVGVMDTPTDNASGITGSIAVTGWAVDDVGIVRVRIMRDPVDGEASAPVLIGDAVQVEGARPDVTAIFPTQPQTSRAGWGYLLLTNFLPNLGTGTFRLHAYAEDAEGNSQLLGSRTITCTNDAATLPFGAIDTPGQGQTVSGTVMNFGWVLSPGTRRADPPSGTVSVIVDGVTVGSPAGWTARTDLTALFAAAHFSGISRALGVFTLDTTALTNAVHTIAWIVTDDQGGAAGVGSRYFTVANGSSVTTAPAEALDALSSASTLTRPPARAIEGRRGFDLTVPLQRYDADDEGRIDIQAEELDRIELRVGPGARGMLRTAAGSQELPIGSRLDPQTGIFTWQPGVAFVGPYDFVFNGPHSSASVRIVLNPKGSARVGPQLVIDLPSTSGAGVDSTFTVAGWAADLDSQIDAGVDTVHVWAYPVAGVETKPGQANPIFLGAAAYGGDRPDVAAIYGERFLKSGFGLTVSALQAGSYDIAVFPYSTAKHRFTRATVVRVRIGENK